MLRRQTFTFTNAILSQTTGTASFKRVLGSPLPDGEETRMLIQKRTFRHRNSAFAEYDPSVTDGGEAI